MRTVKRYACGGLENLQYIVLCVWVVHWQRDEKEERAVRCDGPGDTCCSGCTGRECGNQINVVYTKCACVTSCSASHSKGIVYYLAGVIPLQLPRVR